jgi:hypothetical protein
MNSDHLARYYETLTPWERLPLLVDASARGDKVEQDRLARSAPKNGFGVPDYWGLAEGLDDVAKHYLLVQLDIAAYYWRLSAFFEDTALLPRDQRRLKQARGQRFSQLQRLLAYRCVVLAEAWKLLCGELHVDADALTCGIPGHEVVQHMVDVARLRAFTPEEALAYLRKTLVPEAAEEEATASVSRRAYQLDTAADVAALMRQSLQESLDEWR